MKWFLTLAVALPVMAKAQMDGASRDLLIEKLSKVNLGLAPQDPSKVSVTLRLADLLAERARLDAMKELEGGCTVCSAGQADREKSLRLYREVLDRVPEANRGKVLVQVGHLYQMTGNEKEAESFYERILKETNDPSTRGEALLSQAEMAFKKNQFARARSFYQQVLEIPTASSRGLAAYRSAWCSFNLGEIDAAVGELSRILKTPALQNRTGVAQNQADPQFKEEVSRDLATFLSKKTLQPSDIQNLFDLSPESTRVANVTLLALETGRMGRKKETLLVWNFVHAHQPQPAGRLEALLHRSPLWLESGEREKALQDLEAAVALWKELGGCGSADCSETRKLFRGPIVVWNQAEKTAPTKDLSKAYGLYLEIFPDDAEMAIWGAGVAQELKDWPVAFHRQEAAANALASAKDDKTATGKLESVLLTAIEMAEASGDDGALLKFQDLYLARSPTGSKSFEVRYQKARRLYEKNQHLEAASQMKALALQGQGPQALRKQAADLALDSLAILKEEDRMVEWSREFAAVFKDQASDFHEVGQKAILTRSATLAATDAAAAWTVLEKFEVKKAAPADRITFLKNRIILGEKTANFTAAQNAADELLALKEASAEDREFALARKAWLSELRLDFASAFQATEQMKLKELAPEQKALKLALYADLSGRNPVPLYQQYLKTTKDEDGRRAVASEIVRRAPDPVREIEAHKGILEKSPDLLARLYTEAYAKTPSEQILKKASADTRIQKTDGGRLLKRAALLTEFERQKARLAALRLDPSNQKNLNRTIRERAAELTKLDKLAADAIQAGDWTSQLVTIDLVSRESDRFYQELLGLPMPEGLAADEEQEYLQLLTQQASPFRLKAEQATAKIQEFWARPSWKADLEKSVRDGAEFRGLVTQEIAALQAAAAPADQEFLAGLAGLASRGGTILPELQEIEAARDQVRKNPLDRAALGRLLEVEKRARNFAMVQYLEGRLRLMDDKEVAK